MTKALETFQNFGLQVEEIEPTVYKVQNTDKEINIDKLQWELQECILFTSPIIKKEKLQSGINTKIAKVYYVLLDYDNDDLTNKYYDVSYNEFEQALLMDYKHREDTNIQIDTIYRGDEI